MLDALVARRRRGIECQRIRSKSTRPAFRTIRYSVVGRVVDEIAFWPKRRLGKPDSEISPRCGPPWQVRAPCSGHQQPVARRGSFKAYERNFAGRDVLSCSGLPHDEPDDRRSDRRASYVEDLLGPLQVGRQFRTDVESSYQAVEACVVPGRLNPAMAASVLAFWIRLAAARTA